MIASTDIHELIERGDAFAQHLQQVKSRVPPGQFEWYRYDSMGNLEHLDRLLTGSHRDIVGLAGGKAVLDFGCADGDFAFFLESLGLHVHAFDHVRTNHNGMLGVRTLKEQLGSGIEIHEIDLDNNFEIPQGEFGLALVLGILYHLKNPFYVLETIAKQSRYCLLSTRIARFLPDRTTDISRTPMAYLLGEDELNADDSNYWIFSEAGLRRIVERSHWRVLEFLRVGDTEASDPVSLKHDERAFCLLESVYGMRHFRLKEGWHPPESAGWRWTSKAFRVEVDGAKTLSLHLFVPPELVAAFGPVTLFAEANGKPLAPEIYVEPGRTKYVRRLPDGTADVSFRLSHAFPPTDSDRRELGIIIARLVVD